MATVLACSGVGCNWLPVETPIPSTWPTLSPLLSPLVVVENSCLLNQLLAPRNCLQKALLKYTEEWPGGRSAGAGRSEVGVPRAGGLSRALRWVPCLVLSSGKAPGSDLPPALCSVGSSATPVLSMHPLCSRSSQNPPSPSLFHRLPAVQYLHLSLAFAKPPHRSSTTRRCPSCSQGACPSPPLVCEAQRASENTSKY